MRPNNPISSGNYHPQTGDEPGMTELNEQIITAHLQWLRRTTDRAATHKHRRDNLWRLARTLPVALIRATVQHLDNWQAELAARVKPTTVQTYTAHVRAFYQWAQQHHYRDDNPADELPMPRIGKRLPRPIPEKDLRLAMRCATGDMLVWLALAGWCGLRAGEIARLDGNSVLDEPEAMLLHVDGKGGKERTVPVPADLAPMLRGVRKRGRLFLRASGNPVTPNDVSHYSAEFLRSIGLPYVLHQLRHRFGTEFYKISKDIRQTQDLMGHSSPATTSGYVAVAQQAAVKPVNRLGRSLPKSAA